MGKYNKHLVFAVTMLFLVSVFVIGVPSTVQAAKELRVGVGNFPPTFDPHKEVSLTASRVMYNVFDTLIFMDPDDNSILSPGLALSWDRISDTVMEIKLRPNVFWHNGDPFTSKDVKFTFERALYTEGKFSLARSLLSVIKEIETPDDLTVVLTTEHPDPVLEYRLASTWGAWIVPANYIEVSGDDHFIRNPVGTGPFKVISYAPNLIVMERFADYWGPEANVDVIRYLEIPEASARVTALVNNEVEIIEPVPADLVSMLQRYDYLRVVSNEHQLIHLLVYNTQNPLMQNKLFRQALNLGIDRDLIVESLWTSGASSTRGHQFPDYGPMYLGDRPYTEYNPEKAIKLVKESGYKGETVYYDLIPGYYDSDVEAAEIIIEMWKAIGVNAEIRFTSKFWQNEDFGVHPWSYAMRFPDPVGGLWLLWGEFGSRQSNKQWVNVPPRFNELGHELSYVLDFEKRLEIFREMLDLFEDEAPGTTLWRPAITWGINNKVEWTPSDTHTMDFGGDSLNLK